MARISVVAPVYNVEKYLTCFFDNMLKQTYQDFKIFVVYDISTDNSIEILKTYESRYPEKLEILYSPKKNGLGAARDFALDSGKLEGEYILFLDPDDYPEENFLKKMVQTADKSNADITICGFDRFDDATGKVYCVEMTNNKEELLDDFKTSDIVAYINPSVWNKLYRRNIIGNIRFSGIKRAEDLFFFLRVLPNIKKIKFINEVLYHYRVRYDSLSGTTTEENYREFLDGMVKIRDEYKHNLKDYKRYVPLLEMIVFIHAGISITYRLAINNKNEAAKYIKMTKYYFDKEFPGWRHNKYLGLWNGFKRGFKGIGLWLCRLLYKINMFSLFIKFYYFIQTKLKIDIKW